MTTEIKTILISVIVSVTLFVVFVNSPAHLYSFKHWFPQGNLGTTLTTITSSNQLSDFPTTYNANLVLINAGKMEVSTTSVASITTLSNLVTTGALASGSLASGFTDVPVAVGGTGSSTPTGILYGDGAGTLTTIPFGASGEFLTSNGAGTSPTYQASSVSLTDNYTWTGIHTFRSATSTNLGVYTTLTIGTTASSTFQGTATGTSTLQGFLDVSGTNSTSTFSGNLATESFYAAATSTLSGCEGCLSNYQQITATAALPTVDKSNGSATATCPAGFNVIGGGYSGIAESQDSTAFHVVLDNHPSSNSAWTTDVECAEGTCPSGTLTVYAICVNP